LGGIGDRGIEGSQDLRLATGGIRRQNPAATGRPRRRPFNHRRWVEVRDGRRDKGSATNNPIEKAFVAQTSEHVLDEAARYAVIHSTLRRRSEPLAGLKHAVENRRSQRSVRLAASRPGSRDRRQVAPLRTAHWTPP